MPATTWVPLVVAALGTGTAVYTQEQARKRQHEQQSAAEEAAAKQSADARALAAQQASEQKQQTEEADAVAMKKRMSDIYSQTGGGVSPDYYASVLSSQFPSATQDDISKAVSSFFTG